VTRHGGVPTLTGGEAAPGRENGGDDISWTDIILIRPKDEENPRDRFSFYKWTVKI
jgi:hypothetical protein